MVSSRSILAFVLSFAFIHAFPIRLPLTSLEAAASARNFYKSMSTNDKVPTNLSRCLRYEDLDVCDVCKLSHSESLKNRRGRVTERSGGVGDM